jgi:Macrocin-O-methyltransferase (TylF)
LKDEDTMWQSYNHLLRCADIERMRKLLYKSELYRLSLEVPGDVVEVGVFKGTGLALLAKLMLIHEPGSAKRLIGFDVFDTPLCLDNDDKEQMDKLYVESSFTGIRPATCAQMIENAGFDKRRLDLVAGDVVQTCAEYTTQNPGFRISFLLLDLDVEKPTLAALEALWPRVTRGGIVVFDEYAIARWSESNAVDKFFASRNVTFKTMTWGRTPSAYCIKP